MVDQFSKRPEARSDPYRSFDFPFCLRERFGVLFLRAALTRQPRRCSRVYPLYYITSKCHTSGVHVEIRLQNLPGSMMELYYENGIVAL